MRKKLLFPLLAGLLSGLSANAQLPVAKLSTLFPSGAKIGTSAEITAGGSDLGGLRQVFFSHDGITGKVGSDGKTITMNVAKDVPEGIYSAWVVGDFGASNPRAVHVTGLNEVTSTTTNHDFAKAQIVAAGSIVNGHADKENVDVFKVALKKGQRLLAQCLDRQIDSQLSALVTLFDANQRELKTVQNEEILDFTAPADTHVYVRVNDRIFAGGTTYWYRLKITTGPVVDFVLPLAVKPGAKSKVKLYGRNLGPSVKSMSVDSQPLTVKEVEVAAPAASVALPAGVSLDDYQGTVTGFNAHSRSIGFAEAPVLLEAEPNSVATKPQAIGVPCDLSGQFYPARDRDYYTFEAKKGEVYWVEVISHRLGLSTDPLLVIEKVDKKAEGDWPAKEVFTLTDGDKNFGGPDFDTFHHDDDGKFTVPEDGSYRIMIRDLFNGVQSDPRRVYRLIVRKEAPDFQVVVQPVSRQAKTDKRDVWGSNTLLRQGDVEALNVLLFRKDGFTGEVTVEVEGLPAGVSHGPLKFAGSTKSDLLFLRADENAKAWAGPVRIVGKAKIGDQSVSRQARVASVNWDIDYSAATAMKASSRLSDRLVLAIADEPSPLELIPADAKPIEAAIGTKVTVPVKIARRGEFAADLKIKPYGHASLAKVVDSTVKKESGDVVIDLKKYKLPEGTHRLYLKTSSKGKYRPASKELKEAEAAAKSATDAAASADKHAKALAAVSKVKGLTPEQVAAVKKEADEAAKVAQNLAAKRDAAQKKAKDLAAKVKPKDYTADFYSMPFLVTVKKK